MIDPINTHLKKLEELERQRVLWLRLSGFITVVVMIMIAEWDMITGSKIQWVLTSAGVSLSVVWWYWTMVVIRQILWSRIDEARVLAEIANEVQDIKQAIKGETKTHNTDI